MHTLSLRHWTLTFQWTLSVSCWSSVLGISPLWFALPPLSHFFFILIIIYHSSFILPVTCIWLPLYVTHLIEFVNSVCQLDILNKMRRRNTTPGCVYYQIASDWWLGKSKTLNMAFFNAWCNRKVVEINVCNRNLSAGWGKTWVTTLLLSHTVLENWAQSALGFSCSWFTLKIWVNTATHQPRCTTWSLQCLHPRLHFASKCWLWRIWDCLTTQIISCSLHMLSVGFFLQQSLHMHATY